MQDITDNKKNSGKPSGLVLVIMDTFIEIAEKYDSITADEKNCHSNK